METYLVGGAVRDELLGLDVTERDWVVVGASPAEMERAGFKLVGKYFPVFLHPDTGEEYALARTERKTGPGYHGFEVYAGPDVTLEDDLRRRDLTVNAIARAEDGTLIDPFDGQADISNRQLRHVSKAFSEDPLRVLRAARFAARFAGLGFNVADDTRTLMQTMVDAGELEALVPERVWQEIDKALASNQPEVFFTTLRDCGALAVILPELDRLWGVPQPEKWHPEVDTGVHVMMVLQAAVKLGADSATRFAALTHDLGKGTTPESEWPSHHGHEKRSARLVRELCQRLGIPNRYRDLAVLVAEYHGLVHRAAELRPDTVLKLLERTDAFRRPERFDQFLLACEADARGRTGLENNPYPQSALLSSCLKAATGVSAGDFSELSGQALGQAIRKERLARISNAKSAS